MNTAPQKTRIEYIDRLRGLAVAGMFLVHSPAAWVRPEINSSAYGTYISTIAGLIAPVFMTLAGVSMAFILIKTASKKLSIASATRRLRLRGLEVLLVGYGLEVFFWILSGFKGDPTRMLKVNILHCIGAAMMLTLFVARSERGFNGKALALMLFFVFGAQITWRLPQPFDVPEAIWGYLTQISAMSRFPLFPYAGWVAFGLVLGGLWPKPDAAAIEERRFFRNMLIAAVIAYIASNRLEWLTGHFRLEMIGVSKGNAPPLTTIHTFVYKLSMVLFFVVCARATDSLFGKISLPVSALVLMGRTSLFGYVVHLLLIYGGARAGLRNQLDVTGHLIAVAVLTAVMIGLSLLWERYPPEQLIRRIRKSQA